MSIGKGYNRKSLDESNPTTDYLWWNTRVSIICTPTDSKYGKIFIVAYLKELNTKMLSIVHYVRINIHDINVDFNQQPNYI